MARCNLFGRVLWIVGVVIGGALILTGTAMNWNLENALGHSQAHDIFFKSVSWRRLVSAQTETSTGLVFLSSPSATRRCSSRGAACSTRRADCVQHRQQRGYLETTSTTPLRLTKTAACFTTARQTPLARRRSALCSYPPMRASWRRVYSENYVKSTPIVTVSQSSSVGLSVSLSTMWFI